MAREAAVRRAVARSLAKHGWEPMRALERGQDGTPPWPSYATRIFRNNRFTAIINDNAETTAGKAARVFIEAHHAGREVLWGDLQRVKNEIFGRDVLAVQYFPRESELIDAANIYWLYVYPQGVLPEPIVQTRKP